TSPEDFDKLLQRVYAFWLKYLEQGWNPSRYFEFYNAFPGLNEWLGYFQPAQADIFAIRSRFSWRAMDTAYHMAFRFTDGSGKNICLNLLFLRLGMNWRSMLRTVFSEANQGNVVHSFGYTRLTNLPHMEETEEYLAFYSELPSEFKLLYLSDPTSRRTSKPVIRLKILIKSGENKWLNEKNVNFVTRLLLMISLLIPAGIEMGRFGRLRSLSVLMSAAFFAGSLVPVAGLTWLTFSYLNSYKYQVSEKVFESIRNCFQQLEKRMQLQIARNEIYYNLLADRVNRLTPENRAKLPDIFEKANRGSENADSTIPAPIVGYFMLNRNGREMLELESTYVSNLLQIKPFFSGHFNEMLLRMGSYNHLSQKHRQEIEQKAQLALGLTESLADPQMFLEIPEFEGLRVVSTISPKQEFFTGFLLDKQKAEPGGIFVVYSISGTWMSQFNRMIFRRMIPVTFMAEDFRVFLGFFRLDKVNLATISKVYTPGEYMSSEKNALIEQLGQALFVNSGNHEISNLAEKPANLIFTSVLGENSYFVLAYAEEKGNSSYRLLVWIATVLIILALVLSVILAAGTSKIMLMSLPVFSAAIEQVQRQNYNWELVVKSGDEFEELARSFNQMGRKLLEREKMSQLVSQNVMDAVASKDATMLRPGGEKRHAAVLFSDIRGFTTLSERHAAEEIVEMLNLYFTEMAEEIAANDGIIDKLIGDAIQAVFYEREGLDPVEVRAARTAIKMRARLEEFNQGRGRSGKFEIQNGIGIASGMVIAGRVGSETGKLDATVLGKTLKLAESLEARSKFAVKSNILIDDLTLKALRKNGQKAEILPFASETSIESIYELIRLN
ncbi:MAG: adenylate/guanylate cyclase domain-containing protein, partial [Candidatus Riflebacteria bacterium]